MTVLSQLDIQTVLTCSAKNPMKTGSSAVANRIKRQSSQFRLHMAQGTGWLLGMLHRPRNLHMLVLFASDDRNLPVRGSICVSLKHKETHDSGVVCHSNGWT
ncbi:hypothetical protein MKW98_016097 [Papaver atlanticum]|uniref:Uncharacterized protein n=1 Tax=Papaver atlanticum TaxID=357466 RepID=A0AAD4T5C9_9MAGN|nr:hypothetical protein MKW98_016097 [Papaver atlanticum]